MTGKYYCLVAGLPEIFMDQNKLIFSQLDFKAELLEQLHSDDYQLIELFFLPIDNTNLLHLLEKKDIPFIQGGKYTKEELEEDIKDPASLESYMLGYIHAFKEEIPFFKGISWENQLASLYYKYVIDTENVFIKSWFTYELQLNNIITAFNCRKFNMSMEKELIQVNAMVEQMLKNTTKDFGLSSDIPMIEKLIVLFENPNILKREWELDVMKWDYLDELTVFEYFSIEKVISYLIKLGILERWLKLDKKAGKELFDRFVKDIESSYEFPKEYAI